MGNICSTADECKEDEYGKCIREHREKNPQLHSLKVGWEPDANSGPDFERWQGGTYKYPNDIDESLKYTDNEFPPTYDSLIKRENMPYDEQGYAQTFQSYSWRRVTKINELNDPQEGTLKLFADEVTPNDIQQVGLGDCWLQCVFSAIAEVPDRIKKIFTKPVMVPEGVYGFKMFKNGKKVDFVIDDFIPVDQNGNLCLSRTNGNECWAILIEKAYAKLHGSYERISGGLPHEALRDLTMAPSIHIHGDKLGGLDAAWRLINEADHNRWIMCTIITQDQPQFKQLKLVAGHAYSLIGCAEVHDSNGQLTRIVQCRNPWGSHEWQGDWGDNSAKWTDQAKQQVGLVKKDDGAFWISLDHFLQCFDGVMVCKINDNHNFYNSEPLNLNQQNDYAIIKMTVSESGEHTIGLSQKDERCFRRESGYRYQSAKLIVVKPLNGSDLNGGFELVGNAKTSQNIFFERDIYVEMKNASKGTYFILADIDIDQRTFIGNPPFYVNSYGPGKTTFQNATGSYPRDKFIEKVFKSVLQRNPGSVTRQDYGRQSPQLSGLVKYADMSMSMGYIIFYYTNNSQRTLLENMQIQGQGLTMASQSSNTITIRGMNYSTRIGPGDEGFVIIKACMHGCSFGMGGSTQIQ